MTASSQPQPNSSPSLKVVPPTTPSPSLPTEATAPTPTSQLSIGNCQLVIARRFLFLAATLLGLGAIGSIPLPNYVTGQAEIISRTDARQRFVVPVSGRVQIYAKTNQKVQPGQLIAQMHSDDLDNQLAEAQRELERAQQGVSSSQQQLMLARARLQAAERTEAIARARQARSLRDLNESADSPQIQRLQQEQAVLPNEVAAIEAEIAGIEGEISGLQGQLHSLDKTVTAYQSLQSAGAIRATDLWEMEGRQAVLRGQIESKQNAVAAFRRQIQQQQSLMAAKSAQMGEVRQQLGDVSEGDADEWERVAAQTQTARTEVEAATAQIQSQQQLVGKWKADIARLQGQRERLKLVAQTAGTVITPDLDLLSGTRLEAGQEILSVVDLQQLTARVRVRQEDKDLVKEGARVRFYRQGDGEHYAAVVESGSIVPVVQTEESQLKPMVEVRILIDNPEHLLLPGIEGYAHIRTPPLRVYRKVGREFNKLFNLGKYFPWLDN